MHRSRSALVFLLIGLIGLIGLAALTWPYWSGLRGPPNDLDGVLWIARSSVRDPDWYRWVFATRHFQIGFRPVTALTFVLDDLAGGSLPAYRLTDLALHVAVCLAVAGLFRELFPDRHRAAAWLAAAIVALHPAAERVVPVLANRSYSLATLLCTMSLTWGCRAAGRCGSGERGALRASLACGALAAGALLANEVAIVGVACLPALARAAGGRSFRGWRALRQPLCVTLALVMAALAWRFAVVGGLGGYNLRIPRSARALSIFRAVWAWLADFRSVGGALTTLHGTLLLCITLPYYATRVSAARSPATALLRGSLVLWIAAYSVLYATQGIWFPRQLYIVTVPLALLAAEVLDDTLSRRRRQARRLLELVPQLLLLAPIVSRSPAVVGPDPARIEDASRRAALLEHMERVLGECRAPAVVRMVLPYNESTRRRMPRNPGIQSPLPREALIPSAWMRHRLAGRGITVEDFIYYDEDGGTHPALEGLEKGRGPEVVIPPGRPYLVPSRFGNDVRDAGAPRRVATRSWPLPEGQNPYLFLHGADLGRVVPLPAEGR